LSEGDKKPTPNLKVIDVSFSRDAGQRSFLTYKKPGSSDLSMGDGWAASGVLIID
jgi:hypothetical protein